MATGIKVNVSASHRFHRARGSLAVLVGGIMAVGAVSPSWATASAEPVFPASTVERDLTFVPLTRANASQHGYEIRVDVDGDEYGVPIGTAGGAMTDATRKLRADTSVASVRTSKRAATALVTPESGAVCGNADLRIRSTSVFSTSYYVRLGSGNPLRQQWLVKAAVRNGVGVETASGSYDLSGTTMGSQSWSGFRPIDQAVPAGSRLTMTTTGFVVTSLGICAVRLPMAASVGSPPGA